MFRRLSIFIYGALIALFVAGLGGCGASTGDDACSILDVCEGGAGDGDDDSGGSGSSSASVTNEPLQVVVESIWEDGALVTAPEVKQTCTIAVGTAIGTDQACAVSVPEGQLFYSKLKFSMATKAGSCAIVYFKPYYYLASTGTNFEPRWNGFTEVDCTADPIPVDCYNGPAKDLVPSFPDNNVLVHLPDTAAFSHAYTAKSSHEAAQPFSNRWTSNTIDVGTASFSIPLGAGVLVGGYDGYIANTKRDWAVECRDRYEDLQYRITITVTPSPGTGQEVGDWTNF